MKRYWRSFRKSSLLWMWGGGGGEKTAGCNQWEQRNELLKLDVEIHAEVVEESVSSYFPWWIKASISELGSQFFKSGVSSALKHTKQGQNNREIPTRNFLLSSFGLWMLSIDSHAADSRRLPKGHCILKVYKPSSVCQTKAETGWHGFGWSWTGVFWAPTHQFAPLMRGTCH